MAETQQELRGKLSWRDGFIMGLPVANSLFITIGFALATIGAVPAIIVCFVLALIALCQNKFFAEMAAMFPNRPGGAGMFAVEGLKRYSMPLAVLAGYGYWLGWALGLALIGITMGTLIQRQWFPGVDWVLFTLGSVQFGLPHAIAAGALIVATVLNVAGVRVAVRFGQVVGGAFLVVLVLMVVLPFASGTWHADNLGAAPKLDFTTIVVWLFVCAWAIYGTELVSIFAPEYRDTVRDTSRALTSVALFMVGAFTLVPLASAGNLSPADIQNNPITYGVESIGRIAGGLTDVVTIVICGALLLILVSGIADSGRALFGLSAEGLAPKAFDQLSRRNVPSRAMIATLVINLAVVVFVGNPVAILITSNIGYILSITLAVVSFLLLRRDRPSWPRPIRLRSAWIPVAFGVAAFNAFILVVGTLNPELSYAGSFKDVLIGVVLLCLGLLAWVYRRVVEDRKRISWRDTETSAPALQEDSAV